MSGKLTVQDIQGFKGRRKITMLTAYDYPMAHAIESAGIDMILVGDSVANVVLGLESTKDMTMDQMIYHACAVRRGAPHTFVIGDMPFEAYQKDAARSAGNAARFVHEAGCDAVKLEWFDCALEAAESVIRSGIPVMGHVGLTPQTADKLGGFKVQGKDASAARALIRQALDFEKVGCFAVLLECVPDRVARLVTETLSVPTIGIGAGPSCDGQVLVTHDMLGLFERYKPRFVKAYARMNQDMIKAFEVFKDEVRDGKFPADEHIFKIKEEEFKNIRRAEDDGGA
ncbi:3-methyl-2-oxobutanoate hydroxymethyltransferase [Candidatus Velamenicoccus archaeovorus]|uniref:3-methyl-2-oxobutanoate hydroxymethyltransferase n=2 Tax=Velamenicoccus archaeovorus TaxID=1930593 RepID=A0A410P4L2_VELA1|nr:3-methyl-2-oxobutanoate hydroxymethyltransferase [Candidatus Velamenicoccus archaeovorus]